MRGATKNALYEPPTATKWSFPRRACRTSVSSSLCCPEFKRAALAAVTCAVSWIVCASPGRMMPYTNHQQRKIRQAADAPIEARC